METLYYYKENYKNEEAHNDYLWEHFKVRVNQTNFLKEHRDYVEKYQAGFGDRSFHYLWNILLQELKELNREVNCLEIGVFKGQVISLWALIAKELNIKIKITGISPLEGNYPDNKLLRNYYIRKLLSYIIPSIRKDFVNGNIHIKEDFMWHIQEMFKNTKVNLDEIDLIKGYSNDIEVVEKVKFKQFDLIYIDGDHSYEVCKQDIENYAQLLNPNGYLIIDDASNFIPGTKFFKGIVSVSKACEEIDTLKFKNILNIGHNRVFQRQG
jgi:SAM-dependent methyltransferase